MQSTSSESTKEGQVYFANIEYHHINFYWVAFYSWLYEEHFDTKFERIKSMMNIWYSISMMSENWIAFKKKLKYFFFK